MTISRTVEYIFFFSLLVLFGYLVWLIMAPFLTVLILSVIIVVICYPIHKRILRHIPHKNKSLAALVTTLAVLVVLLIPIVTISSLIITESLDFYHDLDSGTISFNNGVTFIESSVQKIIPEFKFDLSEQFETVTIWLSSNLTSFFVGTISTIFSFVMILLTVFYFFRDGEYFLEKMIKISPLLDKEDRIILDRITVAIRSVALGTLFIAIIQGFLVSIGFMLFGIEQAIILGSMAAIGALLPSIGTTIVTIPAIIYLFLSGDAVNAINLSVWSIIVVGLVDNILGPYLLSRGNNLHPFLILIAVLGGLSLFGPIGFIVGPIILTIFVVLLEIYDQYISRDNYRQSEANFDIS